MLSRRQGRALRSWAAPTLLRSMAGVGVLGNAEIHPGVHLLLEEDDIGILTEHCSDPKGGIGQMVVAWDDAPRTDAFSH